MPAVNPRRECPCRSDPLLTGRSEEEAAGRGPFAGLAAAAVVLGLGHIFFVPGWGWIAWAVALGLDLVWFLLLWFYIDEARAQGRHGLGYVRLDAPSFTMGGSLGLHVGASRGLGGLRGMEVWLRCVDAFMEEREIEGEGQGGIETVRICYVVWADRREMEAAQLPVRGEASFQFTLPSEGDFAGRWGTWRERHWEIEVVRHGGPSALRFRVLVEPQAP